MNQSGSIRPKWTEWTK